jgi:ornithine cyclodeaminase/alanine dehydrogenase-like protein (mu-crystallin family)
MEKRINAAIEVVSSAEQAVRDAEIVVTVTTAKEPIIKADWLKRGAHVNAVGSHRPELREIDGVTLARAKVVVDSREAIMAECGDILIAIEEKSISPSAIHAEIGEILAGVKSGRTDESEITLYKSVGIAIQDVAAAHLIYEKALRQGVGTTVEI